jgi:hypothetical protein
MGGEWALSSKARADVAQLVEHHLAKVRVAGSSPVVRSRLLVKAYFRLGDVAVEHHLEKVMLRYAIHLLRRANGGAVGIRRSSGGAVGTGPPFASPSSATPAS